MNTPDMAEGSADNRALEHTNNQLPELYLDHQTTMRQLADRIRWLERHRSWWLFTEAGRAQRDFLDRRAA